MTWWFKKKVKDKPKYNISSEDRFKVTVKKDNKEYYIEVWDWWSRLLYKEEKGEKKDTIHTRNATIQKVTDYKYVLKNIEEMKDDLRKQFIKKRRIQCEPKKKVK